MLLASAAACGSARTDASAPGAGPDPVAAEVRAVMDASAEAWNRGDLDGFLSDYADDASFVTSSGLVHGRSAIRDIYQRSFWRGGSRPQDALRYEGLDVRRIGPETAIAFGRFVLYDRQGGNTTSTGTFSLTLRRAGTGWEIVHDHSSSDD